FVTNNSLSRTGYKVNIPFSISYENTMIPSIMPMTIIAYSKISFAAYRLYLVQKVYSSCFSCSFMIYFLCKKCYALIFSELKFKKYKYGRTEEHTSKIQSRENI